jgi:hypothetical protein
LSSVDIFLDELNKQNNRELDLKNSLENKSNSLITVSGIVIPLLFAFGIFVIEKIDRGYPLFGVAEALLCLIIVLNIISIVFAVLSAKIRNYAFPFLHFNFFDNKAKIDVYAIKEYTDSQPNEFNELLIEEYLSCNKSNFEINEKKAHYIKIGQYIFVVSLVLVPLLVGMVFFIPPQLNSLSH